MWGRTQRAHILVRVFEAVTNLRNLEVVPIHPNLGSSKIPVFTGVSFTRHACRNIHFSPRFYKLRVRASPDPARKIIIHHARCNISSCLRQVLHVLDIAHQNSY